MNEINLSGPEIVWLWKLFFGEKEISESNSIVDFALSEAKKNNMSLEDYMAYRKAKELLNERNE